MKFVLAAALLLLPATAQAQNIVGELRVDQRADGHVVRLRPRQGLVVAVENCVGCAYSWSADAVPANLAPKGVRRISHTRPGMVGGSQTVEFHFRPTHPGRGTLSLSQHAAGSGASGHVLSVSVLTGVR